MPHYLVEQTFAEPLAPPDGARWGWTVCDDAPCGVRWLQAYLAADLRRMVCLCDAPSPEVVRRAAQRNRLPVDRITEVRMLDPFFLP